MFWKKKEKTTAEAAPVAAGAPPVAQEKPKKVKKISPKEELFMKVEMLEVGKAIVYSLPDTFGGGLAVITMNPSYPEPKKGKKYIMNLEALEEGKPSGKRRFLWDSNKPKDLSDWVMDRLGKPFEG